MAVFGIAEDRCGIKACPVIADLEHDGMPLPEQANPDVMRGGVARGISEAFAGDPEY